MTVVIDTNVILVANRQHPDVSEECVAECAGRLAAIMQHGRVAIDDSFRILEEYQNKTNPRAGRRAGDVFLKWLLRNNANAARCDRVHLTEHPQRGFESFPIDARLANFDPPDRVFVAVAAAHADKPPILQAADSKWLGWNAALAEHGVRVDFVCPSDIAGFESNKQKHKEQQG